MLTEVNTGEAQMPWPRPLLRGRRPWHAQHDENAGTREIPRSLPRMGGGANNRNKEAGAFRAWEVGSSRSTNEGG